MTPSDLVNALRDTYGDTVTTGDIRGYCAAQGISMGSARRKLEQFKISRGKWDLTVTQAREQLEKTIVAPTVVPPVEQNLVPEKDGTFVKFGPFTDLKKIISSKLFYPTFITGLSGNGKTFGVEQACAQLGRELIRVNITIETDEDDLIGGFRLVNGETVWHNGPVIEALERGSILLLDEIDLASNKILCLQSVLEGSGVFLKKIGKFVRPTAGFNIIATANTKGKGSDDGRFIGTNVLNEAFLERFPVTFEQEYPTVANEIKILNGVFLKKIGRRVDPASGFNVIATANTKGKGSDDGRFIGTNVLNEAFLERFPVTFEQSYPSVKTEQKILENVAKTLGVNDVDFCKHLVDWGDIIRKTFYDGGIEEIISTRRLVHIIRAYSIFADKAKAIQVCVNRFDDETKQAFMELYDKVDADFAISSEDEDGDRIYVIDNSKAI